MSQYRDLPDITLKAAGGSCPAYRVVTLSAANTGAVHVTSTSLIFGISMEDASATGQAWKVRIAGTAKASCGASVSAGSIVIPQTDTGKVIQGADVFSGTATTVPRSVGTAMEAGSTNSVIEVAICINNIRLA